MIRDMMNVHMEKMYSTRYVGRGVELHNFSSYLLASPTWTLSELLLLGFYGGFIT